MTLEEVAKHNTQERWEAENGSLGNPIRKRIMMLGKFRRDVFLILEINGMKHFTFWGVIFTFWGVIFTFWGVIFTL